VQDYILTACSPSPYTSQPAPAPASATMTRPIEYSRVRQGGMPYDLATPLPGYPQGSRGADPRPRNNEPRARARARSVLNARGPSQGARREERGEAARIIVYWCTLRGPPPPPRALVSPCDLAALWMYLGPRGEYTPACTFYVVKHTCPRYSRSPDLLPLSRLLSPRSRRSDGAPGQTF